MIPTGEGEERERERGRKRGNNGTDAADGWTKRRKKRRKVDQGAEAENGVETTGRMSVRTAQSPSLKFRLVFFLVKCSVYQVPGGSIKQKSFLTFTTRLKSSVPNI